MRRRNSFRLDRARDLTVKIDGEVLQFTYRPYVLGAGDAMAFATRMQAAEQAAAAVGQSVATEPGQSAVEETADALIGVIADMLARAITQWNMQDHGHPVPITSEALRALPAQVLGAIAAAVVEDKAQLVGVVDQKKGRLQ